jgi:hypothetical protein
LTFAVVHLTFAMMMLFPLVQVIYWLALATWFGGVLFIMMAAPVVFRTVKQHDPLLPHVLSVNLEGQHATLLAGTIVGDLIAMLFRIELLCAGVLFATIAAQWFLIDIRNPLNLAATLVRSALYVAATVIVIYDSRVLWPRIRISLKTFIEHADEPEVANPARDEFHSQTRQSLTLLTILVAILLAIVLFSGNIHQAAVVVAPAGHAN